VTMMEGIQVKVTMRHCMIIVWNVDKQRPTSLLPIYTNTVKLSSSMNQTHCKTASVSLPQYELQIMKAPGIGQLQWRNVLLLLQYFPVQTV
jgi:hypothetical protein